MKRVLFAIFCLVVIVIQCKRPEIVAPPGLVITDEMPEWWRALDLLPPESIVLKPKTENKFVMKSALPKENLIQYYKKKLKENGFSLLDSLTQGEHQILQFEKHDENKRTVISLVIEKLPFGKNHLIRPGRSEVLFPDESK